MHNCPDSEELSALVDGDLANERELEVRRHLERYASCTRMLRALGGLKRAVGRVYQSESPPAALRRAVISRSRHRRRGWHWWSVAVAAMLLATVGPVIFDGDQSSPLSTLAKTLVAEHVESLSVPNLLETATGTAGLSGWYRRAAIVSGCQGVARLASPGGGPSACCSVSR